MDILNKDIRQEITDEDYTTDSRSDSNSLKNGGPTPSNEQTVVLNEEDQNRPVNTGDPEYKENVTGRTPEESPRDLNLSSSDDSRVSEDVEGGSEIETPHKIDGEDASSTERKIPNM